MVHAVVVNMGPTSTVYPEFAVDLSLNSTVLNFDYNETNPFDRYHSERGVMINVSWSSEASSTSMGTPTRNTNAGLNVFEGKLIIPLYVTIFFLSVLGNSLVLVTLVQNKRMRTVTNVYLLNLVSDKCVKMTQYFLSLFDLFGENCCGLGRLFNTTITFQVCTKTDGKAKLDKKKHQTLNESMNIYRKLLVYSMVDCELRNT